MHEDLQHLVVLNDADDALDSAVAALKAARAAVAEARARRDAAETERDAAQAELDACKTEGRALKRKVEQYEARRATATRALEMGAGDPDAAERQIAQVSEILDDTETEQLENMEQQEALETALQQRQTAVDEAEAAVAAAEAAAPDAIATAEAQEAAARTYRDAVRPSVPRHLLGHYERLRQRKRKPLVRLDDRTCPACQMMIGAARVSELRRGVTDLLTCPGCKRIVAPTE